MPSIHMELSPARRLCDRSPKFLLLNSTTFQGSTLCPLEISAASPQLTAAHRQWKRMHQGITLPSLLLISAMLLVWRARQADTDLTFHIPLLSFTSAALSFACFSLKSFSFVSPTSTASRTMC